MAQIISSFCGCITLLISNLYVIDSDRLPVGDIQVWKIVINDSLVLEIEEVFQDKDELLVYLNTTFVSTYDLDGYFTIEDGVIYYSNPENYDKIEIVAILETTMLRYKMGSAPDINLPSVPIPNSNVIVDSNLVGVEVLQVQVDTSVRQPITLNGWLFDSVNGAITFDVDNPPQDQNIYVLVKQTI